jgi:predicted dehydrogenase/aryl-alcohol dehydrogenase-like predicted oxidoreductase
MAQKLNWGLIACGNIAGAFATAVPKSKFGNLMACASRDQKKADEFGKQYGIPKCYGSYEALLADKEIDAVYVSTPHPQHAEWAIKAAEAGKHILCEKPLTLNYWDSMAVIQAAREHKVFLMEAFMYRCHPQTRKILELIKKGVIGEVRAIQATFSFRTSREEGGRLLENAAGGGGILDVGCYPTSMCRLIAGAAQGKDFAEPIQLSATGVVAGKNGGVDEVAMATAKFPGDILAQLATGVLVTMDQTLRVFGTHGTLAVPTPWVVSREGGKSTIQLFKEWETEPYETITIDEPGYLYAIEADACAEAIFAGRQEAAYPAMSWEDTLGNMKMLDQWREAIGLEYAQEKFDAKTPPVHGRKLAKRKDAAMKHGKVTGVEKPVSRLVMGVDNQVEMRHASVVFDDYFERGGNAFDTAFIYGKTDHGQCEKALGQWIKKRGVRSEVVILGKGACTPHCNPEGIRSQLKISLERLQTDHVDIYMLHRDNTDVPVADFCETLNDLKKQGKMKAFGGSNWTLKRVEEFNEYAKKKGLTPMAAVSNNFSLARMVNPVWGGCLASSDPESRAWLTRHQLALMPWSSQARGFFTDLSGETKMDNEEMVNSWYSPDNFQRKERATELAKKKGVKPITIAMAYVLNQPFPTFPLFGPRKLTETTSSMEALGVELTPHEIKWLNLEA